jgi:hypothetical protein
MKRTVLAAVAFLTLTAGCAASTNEPTADDSAAIEQAARTISIDFRTDITNFECDFDGGDPENWSVQFDFQGRHYDSTRHIDFWGCQADRGSLFDAGVHSAVIVHEQTKAGDTSTLTIDGGRESFVARAGTDATTTVPITFNLETDGVNAACRVRQGWFIEFGFHGQSFSAYGGDDVETCKRKLATLEGAGSRQATLTVERTATFVRSSIVTDGGWTFTSYERPS